MRNYFFVLVLLITSAVMGQGKLNKAKDNINKSKSSASARSSKDKDNDDGGDGVSEDDVETFLHTLSYSYVGLFGYGEFTDLNIYPYYENAREGEYLSESVKEDTTGAYIFKDAKEVDFRLDASYFGGGAVNGVLTKVTLKPVYLVGVDVSYNYLYEDVIDETVKFEIFSAMANYYRVRTGKVTGYWGLGYTYVGRGVKAGGFAYQLGVGYFVKRPFSLSAIWKQSFLHNATINEFSTLGKYHYKRAAFYVGWKHHGLAGIPVNGAVAGIQYIIN